MAAGPRVLTFFLYLSDVEEGGETYFPKLNISVKPHKGSALLWPSVDNEYPDSIIEDLTYHAALPVKKGVKFAANSWIHLRNYKTPNLWGCTGAFD
jgi:prolyl 4-hydroxylase